MAKDVTASQMLLEFQDLKLWMGLEVRSVRITAPAAAMVLRPFSFDLTEEGDLEAIVEESGIQSLLQAQAPPQLRDFSVEVKEGKLHVHAVAKLGFKVPIEAIAELYLEDESRLLVRLISAGKVPGPVYDLVAKQVEKSNPLLEASDWPMKVTFTSVRCEEGKVILLGKALGI